MSIGNCETIDLNNSRINTNNKTHESNDISLSINNSNLTNSSKIATTGNFSEQSNSSSVKTINGENMNKGTIEDKKRKLTLPLLITNDDQKNFSSDSINGSNSNSGFSNNSGSEQNLNKRHKAAYFDNGLLFPLNSSLSMNETPSLNKDLIKHLDHNNMSTPQIDKLIHDLHDLNSTMIKTPGSAIALLPPTFFTPNTEAFITNIANSDTTPGSTINPSIIFSNHHQLGSTTTTGAISAATVAMAPSITGSNTSNSNNHYAMLQPLTNVSNSNSNPGNLLIFHNNQVELTDQNRLDYKNVQYGDNILTNKTTNNKDEKDNYLQTVPVHPTNLVNNNIASNTTTNNITTNNRTSTSASNKTRGKSAGKTTKSASIIKQSESFNDSSTNTPNSSTFTSRRDTGNSTTSSSSNLDTSFSPINLDKQETMKLEKKRERNREAARKCRTRKLEKIASLEIQVKNLTETNELEKAKTDKLREEINVIRMKLEQHKRIHNCDLKLTI